jgi:hypothetical protein
LTVVPWVLVFFGDRIRARSPFANVSPISGGLSQEECANDGCSNSKRDSGVEELVPERTDMDTAQFKIIG